MSLQDWSLIVATFTAVIYLFTLLSLVRANSHLGSSLRIDTLAHMVSEMNEVRRSRAEHPEVERHMFAGREGWSDEEIRHHLVAVQLANILEWAYLARCQGLLEKDVWESWVDTWRDVIVASEPLQQSFGPAVWTFGRDPVTSTHLRALVSAEGDVTDPIERRSRWRRVVYGS